MAIINGTSGNDSLFGSEANDSIIGNGGDDVISGLGGNDSINGGDGNDALYGGATGSFPPALFQPIKTATTEFTVTTGGWTDFDTFPRQVADMNGDGRADIIGFSQNNVFVALGKADGTFEPAKSVLTAPNSTVPFTHASGWISFDKYPRQVADVNGDGRADVIGFGQNNVLVALGKADGTFEPAKSAIAAATVPFTQASSWTSFDKYPRQVADVNGDGRADIIGFGNVAVLVSLGKADGTFETDKTASSQFTFQNGWTSFDKVPRQVADVNGDGRADIIGFDQNNVLVALGKADGTFETAKNASSQFTGAAWSSFDKSPRQVIDVNRDGRADIVGFDQNNVLIAYAKADGTFEAPQNATSEFTNQTGWRSFNQSPRKLADINGDGAIDVVGFGQDRVVVALGQLEGVDGNDLLDGGLGADNLAGGIGNDTYVVDNALDIVTELANEGVDTVISSVSYRLGSHLENLTLDGTSRIDATGNELNNLIVGNVRVNSISGEAGDDILVGGVGRDRMRGDIGADRFVFSSLSDRGDRISDFKKQEGDKLVFDLDGFARLSAGGLRSSQFVRGKEAIDQNDRFIYNQKSGRLFYDSDGIGSKKQVEIAVLGNKPAIAASDILITPSPF